MKDVILNSLLGTWKNKDIPMYNFNDKIEICITFWDERIVVSIQTPGEEPLIIASGDVNLKKLENDSFIIHPADILKSKVEILCKCYIGGDFPSFIASIEPYGERYFVKL